MLINYFKALFSKKEEPDLDTFLEALKTGDWVEFEYYHPNEIGIISNNTLSNTRLNPDELKDRVIRGCIERVRWEDGAAGYSISIKTFKVNENYLTLREFMLMSYEVKTYRYLT